MDAKSSRVMRSSSAMMMRGRRGERDDNLGGGELEGGATNLKDAPVGGSAAIYLCRFAGSLVSFAMIRVRPLSRGGRPREGSSSRASSEVARGACLGEPSRRLRSPGEHS